MTDTLVALLGGTFDPVHLGHLAIAQTVLDQTPCQTVQFVPCQRSALRQQPQASATQRKAMLDLATQHHAQWSVNDIELMRPAPSYTIDTLKELHKSAPHTTWCWVMGADAWAHIEQWKNWQVILQYSHILVINRPGYTKNKHLMQTDGQLLSVQPHGLIIDLNMPEQPISATAIRERLAHKTTCPHSLPQEVRAYIKKQKLYGSL